MTETTANNRSKLSKKTVIELIIFIALLGFAVYKGVDAYHAYQNYEKAAALFAEGDECIHHNDIAGAKAKFTEAVTICPYLRGAYQELAALAYYEDKNFDEACKYYDQAIVAMPDCPELYITYAQFMFATLHYEKARDLAQKAVDLAPNDKVYKNNLDLFTKICTDPEMQKNHLKAKQEHGNDVEIPGAHHYMHNHEHAEGQPADAQPADAQPAEAHPAEAQPAEAQPAEAQPIEAQPADAQPAEAQPAEAQPAEAQPAEAKPAK